MTLTGNNRSEVCHRLLRFDRSMRRLQYHLRCLDQDLALMDAGWTLYYALDWCELYRYAFGAQGLLETTTTPELSAKQRQQFVDKAVSTKLLLKGFHDSSQVVLLPPYAYELSAFLERLKTGNERTTLQLERLRKQHGRNDELCQMLQQLLAIARSDGSQRIPKELIARVYKLLRTDYKELLFDALAVSSRGVDGLAALLTGDHRSVRFLEDVVPDLEPFFSEVNEDTVLDSAWFGMFQEVRGRWTSDYIDASAILLVEQLNRLLVKKRQLILLCSDAYTMTCVLNWDLLERQPPTVQPTPRGTLSFVHGEADEVSLDYRLLRTPRTFLLYLLHTEKNTPPRDSIRQRLGQLSEYFTLAAAVTSEIKKRCPYGYDPEQGVIGHTVVEDCTACPYRQAEGEMLRLLNAYDGLEKEYDVVQLILRRADVLDDAELWSEAEIRRLLGTGLTDTLVTLAELQTTDESFLEKTLRARREKLESRLLQLRGEVTSHAVQWAPLADWDSVGYNIEKLVRICGRLGFNDRRIRAAINDLLIALEGESRRGEEIRSRLLQLNDLSGLHEELGPESKLLRAVLAYVCDEREYAWEVCESELRAGSGIEHFGLLYMRALTMGAVGIRARDADVMGIALNHAFKLTRKDTDGRAWHLFGLLSLRSKKARTIDVPTEAVVERLAIALEKCTEADLRLAVQNNLLYAICLFVAPTPERQDQVEELLRSLERSHEVGVQWSSYHDTEAAAYQWLSISEPNKAKTLDLLRAGRQAAERAVRLARRRGASRSELQALEERLTKVTASVRALVDGAVELPGQGATA